MWRSVLFLILGIGSILIYLYTAVKKELILVGLALFTLGDLISVDLNYLNNKKQRNNRNFVHWIDEADNKYPLSPTQADKQILESETANNPELKKKIESVQVEREGRRGKTQSGI